MDEESDRRSSGRGRQATGAAAVGATISGMPNSPAYQGVKGECLRSQRLASPALARLPRAGLCGRSRDLLPTAVPHSSTGDCQANANEASTPLRDVYRATCVVAV